MLAAAVPPDDTPGLLDELVLVRAALEREMAAAAGERATGEQAAAPAQANLDSTA